MPVYEAATGTGRMLALDLDPGRCLSRPAVTAGRDSESGEANCRIPVSGGTDPAAGSGGAADDPAPRVGSQAAELGQLLELLGARYVADISPSGGRHVYVPFAAPLPWLDLRNLARALALRFPAIDPTPMSGLGGQISPPGSRHKSGGWRVVSMPLEDAAAAVERPNGPDVWASLLDELAAELRQIERGPESRGFLTADEAELDDTGVPWVPCLGGRAPLGGELERVARSGRWDRSRYAGRSEARMAVLGAAAARGWRLAEVRSAVASGAWKGLAGLYGVSVVLAKDPTDIYLSCVDVGTGIAR